MLNALSRAASSAVVVVMGTMLGNLHGQGWTFRTSTTNPIANSTALAFDSFRGVSVLLADGGVNLLDVWEWNGTSWLPYVLSNRPNPRQDHAAAYDPNRRVTVMFSGRIPGGMGRDTWEWDGSAWFESCGTCNPSGRAHHAMVYDSVRRRIVMFGGVDPINGNAHLGDTWEYDGAWRAKAPLTSPSPRRGHVMAFDEARSVIVLFGGSYNGVDLDDTWTWNGTNWTEEFPSTSPAARSEAAMAYDPQNRSAVLFGGSSTANGLLADTWIWDGTSWAQVNAGARPARRYAHSFTWDTARGVGVLFGGTNGSSLRDTWEYAPIANGSFTPFGVGCPGSRGLPYLSVPLGTVPLAGQPFSVQINNIPLTGSAWMVLGASNTMYGSLPLPLILGSIGMTNCSLYASVDSVFPVTNLIGTGLWTFSLPPFTAGFTFYNQGIVFDAGVNPLNLILSNAATVRAGL